MIAHTNSADMRQISQEDLAELGSGALVYVKPIVIDGQPAFSVHAADGAPLALAVNRDLAFAAAIQHEMEPVSVH
ncbi:DUF1150 family protein [Zavarzinia aquatilis]|uniref:DUF1150 domain-containing protein n=1 Tax=Zavarzinia aquatilis TaxID=2211142 RepID=A0A317DXL4_9PROT|nr:DUF1150 family protein [Zavarzinia aquatilis]PWR19467.1 hypothetical protein DKG74_16885 [Zavarzinia aquatilis]